MVQTQRRFAIASLCALSFALAIACGPGIDIDTTGDAGSPFDAGQPQDAGHPDAGHDGGSDAGHADAGHDGGQDAGEPDAGEDAGEDGGPAEDAGGSDAGEDAGQDAGAHDAGASDAGSDAGQPPSDGGAFTIRIMNGNLTSGTSQGYEQPGIDIFEGLHSDIATVQEFNVGGNSQAELDTFVHTAFGADANYYREPYTASGTLANGIVTHFPIISSGSFTDPQETNRGFAWAEIELPNGQHLWAYSLHLSTTSSKQGPEATALVPDIQGQVPSGDYITIGGDFNSSSRTAACVTTLGAVTVVSGPYPVDNLGNGNTSGNRSKPHDWVLASPNLDALQTPVAIGANSFPSGLVVDTRVYTPLADIAPAQQGDSGATNMQHMGVVRDFLIP